VTVTSPGDRAAHIKQHPVAHRQFLQDWKSRSAIVDDKRSTTVRRTTRSIQRRSAGGSRSAAAVLGNPPDLRRLLSNGLDGPKEKRRNGRERRWLVPNEPTTWRTRRRCCLRKAVGPCSRLWSLSTVSRLADTWPMLFLSLDSLRASTRSTTAPIIVAQWSAGWTATAWCRDPSYKCYCCAVSVRVSRGWSLRAVVLYFFSFLLSFISFLRNWINTTVSFWMIEAADRRALRL